LTAAFYNGRLHACGGFDNHNIHLDCFKLAANLTTWEYVPRLPRSELATMASSVVDGKWVITVGRDLIIYDGSSMDRGRTLPVPKSHHCQVTIDDENIFIGDGTESFLLNINTQLYTPIDHSPTYPNGACGLVNNAEHGEAILMSNGHYSYAFSLTNLSWTTAPLLGEHVSLSHQSSVQLENGFLSIGGVGQAGLYNDVDRFDGASYEWFKEKDLLRHRRGAAAVALPDDYLNCV